jgi:hypothetical protein
MNDAKQAALHYQHNLALLDAEQVCGGVGVVVGACVESQQTSLYMCDVCVSLSVSVSVSVSVSLSLSVSVSVSVCLCDIYIYIYTVRVCV